MGALQGEGAFGPEPEAGEPGEADERDPLAEEFSEIDAVLARSARILEGENISARKEEVSPRDRLAVVYDLDWNEEERLAEWQHVLAETRDLPAVLRAAILLNPWTEIEVLQHAGWLGPLLVAALLRREGIAAHHLACLHLGAKNIPRERRRAKNRGERLLASSMRCTRRRSPD